jgi:hypothetical protein
MIYQTSSPDIQSTSTPFALKSARARSISFMSSACASGTSLNVKTGSAWVDGAKQQIGKCVMNERRDPGAVGAIAGRGPFPLEDEGCGLEK